jgi:hypothetical protein
MQSCPDKFANLSYIEGVKAMTFDIRKSDTVFTADGAELGAATTLYVRPEASLGRGDFDQYLMVVSLEEGNEYYIPTNFIDARASETGKVRLSLATAEIEESNLKQRPPFIERGEANEEALADEPSAMEKEKEFVDRE